MGKKSRQTKPTTSTTASQQQGQSPLSSLENMTTSVLPDQAYTSDGPSEEELNVVRTSSVSLQNKLNQLMKLATRNDRAGFVSQFVPLDLSKEDTQGYLEDLTTAMEAESQWNNLISEISTIATGRGVNRIEGDQVNQAIFMFRHAIHQNCDREVSFICVNEEWRAEA